MVEQHLIVSRIQSKLGPGTAWQTEPGQEATGWPLQSFDLIWTADSGRDSNLRALWRARPKGGAQPVIVVSPSPTEESQSKKEE